MKLTYGLIYQKTKIDNQYYLTYQVPFKFGELLEYPQNSLNYKVICKDKLECLKINEIGQSAAKHRAKSFVKVQRIGVETTEMQNIIYPRVPNNIVKQFNIDDICWTIQKYIEIEIKNSMITSDSRIPYNTI